MKTRHLLRTTAAVLPLAMLLVGGCAQRPRPRAYGGVTPMVVSPDDVSRGAGTGIESQDLVQVTDKMARRIIGTPAIANAPAPPVIGLLPVENNTRFVIQKDIFNKRIKALLNRHCLGKVQFVARDRMEAVQRERQMKDEGVVTSSSEGELAGVDYFLTGELTGMHQAGSTGQSDYILYTFRLINAETSIEEWEDFDEIKKEGLEDVIYR